MSLRKILASVLLVVVFMSGYAQRLDQIVPEAAAVKHGVLKNGMSYYICKIPKDKKSSFYVIQRTGSLVEREDERGLAHFVEHLVFNGTKNYKKHAIIDYVRSLGADFGKDLNAKTGHEYTAYQMENIAVRHDSVVDNCLLMLRDMMYDAELNDEDIEKERNVIVEEAMMRGDWEGASLLNGTPFSLPVIGDMAVIRHCPAQKVRDFYHRWYQPQMQAIVVMHHADTETMLSKVKNVFESVSRGSTGMPERIIIPTFAKPRVKINHDKLKKEGVKIELRLLLPHAEFPKNTIGYYLDADVFTDYSVPLSVTFQCLNSLGINSCGITKEKINNLPIFNITAMSDKGMPLSVLHAFLSTLKSVRLFGFPDSISHDFIKRSVALSEKKDSLVEWHVQDSVLSGGDYQPDGQGDLFAFPNPIFEKCKRHFLYGEPILDSETERQINSYLGEVIDVKEMQRIFNQLFISSNHYYDITIPQHMNLSEEEVLAVIKDVENTESAPLHLPVKQEEKQLVASHSLSSDIIPGEIVSDRRIADGAVREIVLSNGVTVLINKVNNAPCCESFKAFRVGGYGLYDLKQQKMLNIIGFCLNGKINRISRSESSHDIFELSCIHDWEESLREIYKELTDTKLDTALLRKIWTEKWNDERSEKKRFLKNLLFIPSNNEIQFVDSVPTDADIAEILEIWKSHKSNYNGMVVAIDCLSEEDSIIPYIKKYLGSLPTKSEPARMYDYNYYISQDSIFIDTIPEYSPEQKQEVMVLCLFQEQNLSYTPENFVLHQAVESLFKNHLIDFIRLKNRDIYSPFVESQMEQFSHPSQSYRIILSFSPDKKEKIEKDMEELIHGMAYGDVIKQKMVDDFIMSLHINGGYQPNGSKAVRLMNEIKQQGVVIDTRKMNLKDVITIDALKRFLQNLLEKGHRYKSILIPKVENSAH